MTATDELHRLLDERGVEWGSGFGGDTLWTGRDGIEWRWDKQESTLAMYSHAITPAQAIAATLGAGTCHDVGDPSDFCCSECGMRMFTESNDTYTMIDGLGNIIEQPTFCPNCGRRVVEVDE